METKKEQKKTKSNSKSKKKNKKQINIPSLKIPKIISRNTTFNQNPNNSQKSIDDDNFYEKETFFTQDKEKNIKRIGNEIRKFEYIYSPRTTFVMSQEKEEILFQQLGGGFDPITIKIMKSFFKERLGELNKEEFIGLLKQNLLTWHPELPDRDNVLTKLLSKVFDDIDLDNNNKIDWESFTSYNW